MQVAMRDQVEAALGALARDGLADLPPDALATALTVLGDALRADVPWPARLREETRSLAIDPIRAALDAVAERPRRWSLPSERGAPGDDPGLAWAIRSRDEIESARLAIRRILAPRGIFDADLREMEKLEDELRRMDLTCGGTVTRARAEQALEDRVFLDGGDGWMSIFPEGTASGDEDEDLSGFELHALANAGARSVPPSDAIVAEYIRRGALAKSVESAARASSEFAEELEGAIDTLHSAGLGVGLVARRWARERAGARAVVFELPPRRWAAADEDTQLGTPETLLDLGILAPLRAEAQVVLTPDEITLTVYPESDNAVREVRLGAAVVTSAEQGTWTVKMAKPRGPVTLVVTAGNGETFTEDLEFEPPKV